MTDGRLPTEMWVKAHLRRLSIEGIGAVVVRRGEAMGGSVLLKLNQRDLGCRVLTQARAPDGALGWLAAFEGKAVGETEADAYIAEAAVDPTAPMNASLKTAADFVRKGTATKGNRA